MTDTVYEPYPGAFDGILGKDTTPAGDRAEAMDWEIPDQEFTEELRAVGWAPGSYICKCCECGKHHQAAKRSRLCVTCAKAAAERIRQHAENNPAKPAFPEIIARLRNLGPQIGDIAAVALESLARENERLKHVWEEKHASQSAATAEAEVMFRCAQESAAERDALSARLAAMAPVVEAARKLLSSDGGNGCYDAREMRDARISLTQALATLEAANV